MSWDPGQYHTFRQERLAPFHDLFSLIRIRPALSVLDLGCGTGELALELAARLPASRVTGVDSSPQMLAKAVERGADRVTFLQGSVASIAGEWDLLFSHAVLHWVDDHPALIPRLWRCSNPRPAGSADTGQSPSPFARLHHCRRLGRTFCRRPRRLAAPLAGAGDRPVRPAPARLRDDRLYGHGKGVSGLSAERGGYCRVDQRDNLVPYFERLPRELHEPFLQRYRELLTAALPTGELMFTFRRILFAAAKPE